MNEAMMKLRQIEQDILATGKVDGPELERLRRGQYARAKIERPEADFLVELHKRVQYLTPAFDQLIYQAIKEHILAVWLRRLLFADGEIVDEEREFLHELKGEAKQVAVSSRCCSGSV